MAAGQNAALKEEATGGVDPKHPAAGVTRIIDARAGQVEFLMADGTTPRKKIALCGFASSSRDMAPWDDPTWAVVGMNQLNRHIPRADAWFEIHKEWNTALVPGTDHAGWLRDCGIPVFMTDDAVESQIPTWVRFPIEPLIAKFNDYYTSTVAHMVAWATDYIDRRVEATLRSITPNFDDSSLRETSPVTALDVLKLARSLYAEWEIGVYGVDLVVGEEYDWQRPCAEYFLGQALARDITVRIPKPSALLKQRYRYGYEMEPNDLIKDSDLEARRVLLVNTLQKQDEQHWMLIGGLEELKYWKDLRLLRERGAQI